MKATATQTHTFLYAGWNLIRERVEFDGAVSTNQYVWGLDLSGTPQGVGGVGGLLAILTPDSGLLTPAYDANGNITDLVDTNGAIAAHYEYDPFGNTVTQDGGQADANPYRFKTKYWDGETGFYYYGYRYYSPELGRWLNRDPIEEGGGLNIYCFVENQPIRYYDFLGSAFNVLPSPITLEKCGGVSQSFTFSGYNGVVVQLVGRSITQTKGTKVGNCCKDPRSASWSDQFYEIIDKVDTNNYYDQGDCSKGTVHYRFLAKPYNRIPDGFTRDEINPTGAGGLYYIGPPPPIAWGAKPGLYREINISWDCWTGNFRSQTEVH